MLPMLAKGEFYFRPKDLPAQQEFLSYPKGKHDDIMDAIYYALDGHKPCRIPRNDFDPKAEQKNYTSVLDWLTM